MNRRDFKPDAGSNGETVARQQGLSCSAAITEYEVKLMRWYLGHKMPANVVAALIGSQMDEDDLVQDGVTKFLSHPPSPDVKRTTALCNALEWAVFERLRQKTTQKRGGGSSPEVRLTKEVALNVSHHDNGSERVDAAELVSKALPRLSALRADTLRRRFGIGRVPQTLQQIADDRGNRSKDSVRQNEYAALDELRRLYT